MAVFLLLWNQVRQVNIHMSSKILMHACAMITIYGQISLENTAWQKQIQMDN